MVSDVVAPPLFLERIAPEGFSEQVIAHFEAETVRPRSYQGLVDNDLRECNFTTLPTKWDSLFKDIVRNHMEPYFKHDIDSVMRARPMVYGYPVGVGFVPHHDMVTDIERKRGETNQQPVVGGDYTMVMFCSRPADYGGGELYFPEHGWSFKPPPGSAVVYPTTTDYVHGVKPITRGIRHVIVARFHHL